MNYDIYKTSYMALPGLMIGLIFTNKRNINDIINVVSSITEIAEDSIRSKSRRREFVEARHICIYLARKNTNLSLKEIGTYFNNRDHTSVIYAIRTINNLCYSSEDFKQRVLFIENKLSS